MNTNQEYKLVSNCGEYLDEKSLLEALQNAINMGEVNFVKQIINQGAKPELLYIYALRDINSIEILEVLLDNGFNIHADANMIIRQWMGASESGSFRNGSPVRIDLLSFISQYYLDKPKELEKFSSSILLKSLLFRIGLENNDVNIMQFAILIGVEKNEALNSLLNRYYTKDEDNQKKKTYYEVIEFILKSNIVFKEITISNAVFFNYTEVLNVLESQNDLAYGYEIAYGYENDDLLVFFDKKGLSKELQKIAKMKVSAIKGDMKELRKVVDEGVDVKALDLDVVVQIINKNHVEVLKYLHSAGLVLDISLNAYLNEAVKFHKAYDTVSYLVQEGFDICNIKNIPLDYKELYPVLSDIWEKRFSDIFDYTVYLATQVLVKVDGKEKEEVLSNIAELSSLAYVIRKSQEKSNG
jgi:hypothetical protein